jgi:hypothetical protein
MMSLSESRSKVLDFSDRNSKWHVVDDEKVRDDGSALRTGALWQS